MVPRLVPVALAWLGLVLLAPLAAANDTDLTYGGAPHALNGNTTVSMKSEHVRLTVGDALVTVDCQFTLANRGPARRVRMGFPDEGGEPDEGPNGKPLPPKGTFETFASWVDGRPVRTRVIAAADDPGSVWHAKTVLFPANGTLQVRDRYTVAVGASVAYYPASVHLAEYVLHTGSSWRGPIGRSEVEVVFRRKGMRAPIMARRLPEDHARATAAVLRVRSQRMVFYRGPGTPAVSGNALRFVRTDWRPTRQDDVYLVFDIAHR